MIRDRIRRLRRADDTPEQGVLLRISGYAGAGVEEALEAGEVGRCDGGQVLLFELCQRAAGGLRRKSRNRLETRLHGTARGQWRYERQVPRRVSGTVSGVDGGGADAHDCYSPLTPITQRRWKRLRGLEYPVEKTYVFFTSSSGAVRLRLTVFVFAKDMTMRLLIWGRWTAVMGLMLVMMAIVAPKPVKEPTLYLWMLQNTPLNATGEWGGPSHSPRVKLAVESLYRAYGYQPTRHDLRLLFGHKLATRMIYGDAGETPSAAPVDMAATLTERRLADRCRLTVALWPRRYPLAPDDCPRLARLVMAKAKVEVFEIPKLKQRWFL